MGLLDKKDLAKTIKDIEQIEIPIGILHIGKTIGEGGTSIVKEVQLDGFDKKFAIKFLAEDLKREPSRQYKRFKQAFLNLFYSSYKLPILPQQYFGHIEVNNKIIPYTLMPFIPKTLKQYRKERGEEFNLKDFEIIFRQLLNNIEILHEKGIIHRDLKPENIFLDENRLLIGDFDISMFDDSEHIKFVETKTGERLANYAFSAPEQSNSALGEISNASDWFAFGQILYWLITGNTIKGQNPISVRALNVCWEKYNDLIDNLTLQEPNKRLNSKAKIEKFLNDRDESIQQLEQEYRVIKTNCEFDKILRKNFPGRNKLFTINDNAEIEEFFNDLNNNLKETALYYRFYHKIGGDFYVRRIKKTYNTKDGTFWLLNNYEFYIRNLWINKSDVGYHFCVIEIEPMKTNEVFGEVSNDYSWVSAGYDKGEYISYGEYHDGYSKKFGELSEDAEYRERYVKNDLLVISPQFSSMYNAFEKGGIKELFEKYRNNNFVLQENFFESMMWPRALRNIHNRALCVEY